MALFCDFGRPGAGCEVRSIRHRQGPGTPAAQGIVVKKAHCDRERYKEFKSPMHEAAFELIEIPHVRQSGKNRPISGWSSTPWTSAPRHTSISS